MEGKRQNELRDHLERASAAGGGEAAKTVGKAGLEAAALGAKPCGAVCEGSSQANSHRHGRGIGGDAKRDTNGNGKTLLSVEQSVTARVMSDSGWWMVRKGGICRRGKARDVPTRF